MRVDVNSCISVCRVRHNIGKGCRGCIFADGRCDKVKEIYNVKYPRKLAYTRKEKHYEEF